MHRTLHTGFTSFLSAPLFAIVLLFSLCLPAAAASVTEAGVVLATFGSVEILRGAQKIPAARKTTLQVNDEIRTGDNARAQLRMVDGSITTLGANTGFRIDRYEWKEKQTAPANVQLALMKGAFRTVTGKVMEPAGSQYQVKTPVGTIGIRGTDFWGGYLDAAAVDVLLIDGSHAVEVTNTSGTVLLEKPGQGTTLKTDQSALVVKEWPKEKVNRAVATITWPDGSTPPTE